MRQGGEPTPYHCDFNSLLCRFATLRQHARRLQRNQFLGEEIQRHAICRHKQAAAYRQLEQIIHKRDVAPVGRHKRIIAAGKRNAEKQQRI